MSDLEERVSALVDDELSSAERTHVLDRLYRDEEALGRWQRWHLVGDVMRGEGRVVDISAAVRARLAAEPPPIAMPPVAVSSAAALRPGAYVGGRRGQRRRWAPLAVGGALAASVAAMMWVAGPLWQAPVAPAPIPLVAAPSGNTPAAVRVVAAPIAVPIAEPAPAASRPQWRHLRPQVDPRLNDYLASHGEYASPAGVSGVLPYAAFVSYSPGR